MELEQKLSNMDSGPLYHASLQSLPLALSTLLDLNSAGALECLSTMHIATHSQLLHMLCTQRSTAHPLSSNHL